MRTKKVILFSLLLNGRDANFAQKLVSYNPAEKLSFGPFGFEIDGEFFEDSLTEFFIDQEEGFFGKDSEEGDIREDDVDGQDDDKSNAKGQSGAQEQEQKQSQTGGKCTVVRGIDFANYYAGEAVVGELSEYLKSLKPAQVEFVSEDERDFGSYVFKGRLGIMLDDFYVRVRVLFPKNTDALFHTSYCAAFSSFVFCDSSFEDRLLGAALRALKKYNSPDFDKAQIKNEEALAAALFFAARHDEISTVRQCSQLFGCEAQVVTDYLKLLSLRQTRKKAKK